MIGDLSEATVEAKAKKASIKVISQQNMWENNPHWARVHIQELEIKQHYEREYGKRNKAIKKKVLWKRINWLRRKIKLHNFFVKC